MTGVSPSRRRSTLVREYNTSYGKDTGHTRRMCHYCEVTKSISEFGKSKSCVGGFGYKCKDCIKESNKLYYKQNRRTIIIQNSTYYKHNKDYLNGVKRKRLADYKKDNREEYNKKEREYKRAWKSKAINLDKYRKYQREYAVRWRAKKKIKPEKAESV